MAQVVSIVPTLMWLQHRLGQSELGSTREESRPPISEKTIEFTPNNDLRSTNVDATGTSYSTDIEATASHKVGSLVFGSKEAIHGQ